MTIKEQVQWYIDKMDETTPAGEKMLKRLLGAADRIIIGQEPIAYAPTPDAPKAPGKPKKKAR